MTRELIHPILTTPIAQLDMSDEFKAMAEMNHYSTLDDMLKNTISEFPSWPGSGYRLLREFLEFLTFHGLAEMLND